MRAILTVLIFLALAGPAWAGQDISGDWRIAELEQVAISHWQAAPDCPAGVVVETIPLDELVTPNAVMQANPWCNIQIRDTLWATDPPPWQMCVFFVHEWGHLLGHGHDDPDPIMRYDSLYAPECEAMIRAAFPEEPCTCAKKRPGIKRSRHSKRRAGHTRRSRGGTG